MNMRSLVVNCVAGSPYEGAIGRVIGHWRPDYPDHPTLNVVRYDDGSQTATDDRHLERIREERS